MPFYAVGCGKIPGIYETWAQCEEQVKKFSGARYKKFKTHVEAQSFVQEHSGGTVSYQPSLETIPAQREILPANVVRSSSAPVLPNGNATNLPSHITKTSSISCSEPMKQNAANGNFTNLPSHITNSSSISSSGPMMQNVANGKTKSSKFDNCTDLIVLKKQASGLANQTRRIHKNGINHVTAKKVSQVKMTAVQIAQRCEELTKLMEGDKRKFSSSGIQQVENKRSKSESSDSPVVYTDGACFNNGRSGATAGIGVWWGRSHSMNVSERLLGRPTNNRAEIHAACKAIEQAKNNGYKHLEIRTDSQFMINSMTKWIFNWKRNGWKLKDGSAVKNQEDFERLDWLSQGIHIKYVHVRGHSGIEGNEGADSLANEGAKKPLL